MKTKTKTKQQQQKPKGKSPRKITRIRDTLRLLIRENCKNTKLEAIIYTQRTWCRLVLALCMLLQGLWVHMNFDYADLEALFSWFPPSSLPPTLFLPPFPLGSSLREGIWWRHHFSGYVFKDLTLCIISCCGSLFLFPSVAEESFPEDGWERLWFMNTAESR